MKNYFAKLADRAALANLSAPFARPAQSGIRDPFDETIPPQPAPVQRETGTRGEPAHDVLEVRPVPSPPGPVPMDSAPLAATTADSEPQLAARIDPILPEAIISRTVPETLAANSLPQRTLAEPRALESDTADFPSAHPVLVPPGPQMPGLNQTDRSAEDALPEEKEVSKPELDEVVLLRKADAFMEKLFERRRESVPPVEGEADSEPQNVLKPNLQPEQSRPQPVAQPAKPQEESDRQSLVIGKLTVEVLPPPTPAAGSPKVVVVRGHRGRQNPFPSSRPFGLGQF